MRMTNLLATSAAFAIVAMSAQAAPPIPSPPSPPSPPAPVVPAPICIPMVAFQFPTLGPAGDGRRTYLAYNCAGCHGGNGAGGMGPNVQTASATLVNTFLSKGSPYGMVSYSHCLSQNDASNLAAYFATVGTASEPTWSDWWNPQP